MPLFKENSEPAPEDSTEETTQSTTLPEFSVEKKGYSQNEVKQYIEVLLDRHEEELFSIVERLKDTQEEHEQFRQSVDDEQRNAIEEKNQALAKVEEYREQLSQAVAETDDSLQEELASLQEKNQQLQQQLEAAENTSSDDQAIQAKTLEIEKLQTEKYDLLQELQTERENKQSVDHSLELQALEQEKDALLQEKDALQKENSKLEDKFHHQANNFEQIESALRNSEKENEEVSQQVTALQTKIEELGSNNNNMGEIAKRMTEALEAERQKHELEMQEEMHRAKTEADNIRNQAKQNADKISQDVMNEMAQELARYELQLKQSQNDRLQNEKALQDGLHLIGSQSNELFVSVKSAFDKQMETLSEQHRDKLSALATEKQALLDEIHSLEDKRQEVSILLKRETTKDTPTVPDSLDPFKGFGESFPEPQPVYSQPEDVTISNRPEAPISTENLNANEEDNVYNQDVSLSDLGRMKISEPEVSSYSGRFSTPSEDSEEQPEEQPISETFETAPEDISLKLEESVETTSEPADVISTEPTTYEEVEAVEDEEIDFSSPRVFNEED